MIVGSGVVSIHDIAVTFAEMGVVIALIFVHHHIVRIVVFHRVSSSHDERGSEFVRAGCGDAARPRMKWIISVVSNLDIFCLFLCPTMMIMTGTRRRSSVNGKMPDASAGCEGAVNFSSYDELGLEFVFAGSGPASCTEKTADDIILDAVLLFSCTVMIIIISNPSRRRRRCGNGRTTEAGSGARIVALVDDGRPFVN